MSRTSIAPGVSPRLEFFVMDATYIPVQSLTHAAVSASSYVLKTAGVDGSPVPCTPTSSVAATGAKAAGQFVTLDSARGHYAIDCAVGAALSTADTVQLAVTLVDATRIVRVVRHAIDVAVSYAQDVILAKLPSDLESGRMKAVLDSAVQDWTAEQRAEILSKLGIGDPEETEPVVITPGSVDETTGYAVVRNANNSPAAGVTVFSWLSPQPHGMGRILTESVREFVSAVNGVVEIPNLTKGDTYYFSAESDLSRAVRFRVPLNSGPTQPIPTLIRS